MYITFIHFKREKIESKSIFGNLLYNYVLNYNLFHFPFFTFF